MSATSTKCTHYWVIDDRDVGTCRYCGKVRDFAAIRRKKDRELGSKLAEAAREAYRASGRKRRRARMEI